MIETISVDPSIYMSSREKELLRKRETEQFEKTFKRVQEIIVKTYPRLKTVQFDMRPFGAAMQNAHIIKRKEQFIEIGLVTEETMRAKDTFMMATVNTIADLFQIDPTQVSTELFNIFFISHEYGHAQDYQNAPEPNFDSTSLSVPISPYRRTKSWIEGEKYENELAALPIPAVLASNFIQTANETSFQIAIDTYPEITQYLVKHNLKTLLEISQFCSDAYRALPSERSADQFAVKFIREQMPEVVDDIKGVKRKK